eukprot:CAMPEP_0181112864 /NCGR_PEP_ID=MMETSP1071-20121207/20036_1 /TAXON_ID=35127 /ORGANISM="Thalassiosira sp., Strain NH16" /LENGTH=242 /DNA_ID=CAMNT_0023196853 /DNA_START=15 /DNA_END=739 /DNA_ORIENTATION=-
MESRQDLQWRTPAHDHIESREGSSCCAYAHLDSGYHKIDSKNDFMLALKMASLESDQEDYRPAQKGVAISRTAADSMLQLAAQNSPLKGLATIQEMDAEVDKHVSDARQPVGWIPSSSSIVGESFETDIMVLLYPTEMKKSKQMRVPRVININQSNNNNIEELSSFFDNIVLPPEEEDWRPPAPDKERIIAMDDSEIEKAGMAFLDQIGKSMGFGQGQLPRKDMGRKERRVGATNHRRTWSR